MRATCAHATPGTCWHSLPMRTCCRRAIHCPKRTCLHSFPLPARTPPAHAKRDVSAFISALGRVAPTPFISQRACRHSFPPRRPVQSTPPSPARACCIHAKGRAGDVYEPPRRHARRATCRVRQNKSDNVHANPRSAVQPLLNSQTESVFRLDKTFGRASCSDPPSIKSTTRESRCRIQPSSEPAVSCLQVLASHHVACRIQPSSEPAVDW